MNESALGRYFVKQVKAAGGMAEKFASPGRRGVPDYVVSWPNAEVDWVELKIKGGRRSVKQKRDHIKRMLLGHVVYTLWDKAQINHYLKCPRVRFKGIRLVWDMPR